MGDGYFSTRSHLILTCLVVLFTYQSAFAQYEFTVTKNVACTSIKNQERTGTCWSFSTVSFLESELIRMGKPEYDLSEMYIVRNIYRDKARNYVLRQGKANFSQGSLSHDVMRALRMGGIVPESVFSGKPEGQSRHDHSEMEMALQGMLDGIVKQKQIGGKWPQALDGVLDSYLGKAPKIFTYKGKEYTAESFAAGLGINPDDYVSITSFSHHPFYETFIVAVPDNYSNGAYYNVPLDEMEAIVDHALANGYTVAWDGDVSEQTFSAKKGVAVIPQVAAGEQDPLESPVPEMKVTQEERQEAYESYATTDDHLMHLTGIAKDQNGQKYFLTKNSWGEISSYEGFLYMSSPYFRIKTIGIMVHKSAIPENILKKIPSLTVSVGGQK